ncbi:MAG TPA: ribbon-helix-helix domain-containing protein [Smithella sp.]|jgi:metal-responsive CopG/Arc/MetJ family transcriptional regulator|nr:ribbon-helix-helix domain-containing protein [Smithella sp.]HOE80614.1 ribbon-helix-helix domain-containing protein [Smithellaceae bacterium]HPL68226.1 ribbon-helix-helix domain-containing protein [Smithellaceae bacterium]HPL98201.1 ribbon-helix-helix domain-containing protein [Smithellaceae bacterium]
MAARERFTTTLDSELLQEIKILAIRQRHSTNDLLEEAIQDLLNKYQNKPAQNEKSVPETGTLDFTVHEQSSKYDKGGSE